MNEIEKTKTLYISNRTITDEYWNEIIEQKYLTGFPGSPVSRNQ